MTVGNQLLCCAVLCRAELCRAVPCCAGCAVPCHAVLCNAVLCLAVPSLSLLHILWEPVCAHGVQPQCMSHFKRYVMLHAHLEHGSDLGYGNCSHLLELCKYDAPGLFGSQLLHIQSCRQLER